jgi:hypothetical protein
MCYQNHTDLICQNCRSHDSYIIGYGAIIECQQQRGDHKCRGLKTINLHEFQEHCQKCRPAVEPEKVHKERTRSPEPVEDDAWEVVEISEGV